LSNEIRGEQEAKAHGVNLRYEKLEQLPLSIEKVQPARKGFIHTNKKSRIAKLDSTGKAYSEQESRLSL